ncbi:hypothetical protein D3C87_1577950 [compost metagenome]
MGKAHQARKAEGAGTALDGVNGAEHGIEPVGVALTPFNGGKLFLELVHQLGTFVEIGGLKVVEVAHSG